MPRQAIDNPARQRYELLIDGQVAFVSYQRSPGVIRLLRAEVPAPLRGRGAGSELVRAVLEAVRGSGESVIPQCAFIADFIGKHSEYHDLLVARSV